MSGVFGGGSGTLRCVYRDERLRARLSELDDAVCKSVDGEVLSEAYVDTWVVLRAALADDDVAIDSGLTAEDFYSETFTGGVAVVLY